MKNWIINIGQCGPTDCTLTLTSPQGIIREALIESEVWKMIGGIAATFAYWKWCMDKIYNKTNKPLYSNHEWPVEIPVKHNMGVVLQYIWDHCKDW